MEYVSLICMGGGNVNLEFNLVQYNILIIMFDIFGVFF